MIKAKRFLKASLFLQDISNLFIVQGRIDPRIAITYFELSCLANIGAKQYSNALDALDTGYKIAQQLPRMSYQASRFITLFEKVVKYFDSNNNEMGEPDLDTLKVPGMSFDQIFMSPEFCPSKNGILIEI